MRRCCWMLLLLPPCFLGAFEWTDINTEFELGYQYAAGFEQNGTTRCRPYFFAKANYSQSCGGSGSTSKEESILKRSEEYEPIPKWDPLADAKKVYNPRINTGLSDKQINESLAKFLSIQKSDKIADSKAGKKPSPKKDLIAQNSDPVTPAGLDHETKSSSDKKPETNSENKSEEGHEKPAEPHSEVQPENKGEEPKPEENTENHTESQSESSSENKTEATENHTESESEQSTENHTESQSESSSECRAENDSGSDEGACLNTYEFSYRIWYDWAHVDQYKNFEIRSLFYERTGDNWSLKVGFQEIAWGETFGLYIADFINPRDLTDPFFNDLSYVRIPVFIINTQYFLEPWSFQLVATPIPRNNLLPSKGDPFDVFPSQLKNAPVLGPHRFAVDRWGQDIEYGGRIGYFFESGLDVTLFYYRHWNRFPTYRIILDERRPALRPVLRRINSVGGSFSKAFESIVLRGDTVVNFHTPWTVHQFGTVRRRLVAQTILGIDYTSEHNSILGFQYHWDQWREAGLHSISVRAIKDFGKNLEYHLQLFVYRGLNNQDLWIQPKFDWDVNDSTNLSIRVDIFGGFVGKGTPKDGFIGPYKHKERVFMWLTYKF